MLTTLPLSLSPPLPPPAQISLLLHQERDLVLQQRGLLEQLHPLDLPQEVHPKLLRANDVVQQRLKLLDEQSTAMAVSCSAAVSPLAQSGLL